MTLLPVADALSRVTKNLAPLQAEQVPLLEAGNRTLAEDLTASLTQPPFNSSAMDGYAVRAADIENTPTTLQVIGEAAAGHEFSAEVSQGQAVRIFTGAPLPTGTDTIVIQENTKRDEDKVTILEPANKGEFVRPMGLDFSKGDILIPTGTKLQARHVCLAAAANHPTLNVTHRPLVAIIATGDEIIPPGSEPASDQIISSSPYGLNAMIENAGGIARLTNIAADNIESLHQALEAAADAHIILTIGGASEGDHDLVQPALKANGFSLDFWKIAMKPGKPLMFGRKQTQCALGLPGNPVSAMICARIFLVPMIARLLGNSDGTDMQEVMAALSAPLKANGPRQHYMRGTLTYNAYGDASVAAMTDQDSSRQALLAQSNCLIVRPPNASGRTIGEKVPVLPIDF